MLGSKDIFLDRAKRELSVMQMNHCGIQECEKGHMWQFQARPYHLLHFVLQGEGSLKISGRMLNVHAGQAFFIPAGIEGKYIASMQNPWKYAWIGFYADNGNKFIDLLLCRRPRPYCPARGIPARCSRWPCRGWRGRRRGRGRQPAWPPAQGRSPSAPRR